MFRLDFHSVLGSVLDAYAILLLLRRQPGNPAAQGTHGFFLSSAITCVYRSRVSFHFMSDETQSLNRKPPGEKLRFTWCHTRAITTRQLHLLSVQAHLMAWECSQLTLPIHFIRVPSLQQNLCPDDFPINVCVVLTISHHSDSEDL